MAAPIIPGTEGLPPTLQYVLTGAGFVVAVAVYFFGLFKKPATQVSKDVVVPNVSVMDAQVYREATDTLRQNMRHEEARQELTRQIAATQREQSELLRDINRKLGREIELLELIDERLRDEHRRLRDRQVYQNHAPE